MYLKGLEISGFKSFAKKTELSFNTPITSIVGPNGSGKSNVAESFRFVLGEQSIKSMRGKRGEDLIFNGSSKLARQNRASVKVTFDNHRRLLNIDFDEVTIERVVHRDSTNEYLLNGSSVRLKDIIELLAQAHIGPSGHHIISQGEADKILNANLRERREMIEDALGLKIYQYKKQESERKLDKTEENIKSVESIRREIKPHLTFLKKQVEKIEKSRALKIELTGLYKEYFKREDLYLKKERTRINDGLKAPKAELEKLDREIVEAKKKLRESESSDALSGRVVECEDKLSVIRQKKDELSRLIGRLEGELSGEERRLRKLKDTATLDMTKVVPLREIESFSKEIDSLLVSLEKEQDISILRRSFGEIRTKLNAFVSKHKEGLNTGAVNEIEDVLKKLSTERARLEKDLAHVAAEEKEISALAENVKKEIQKEASAGREAEREIFRIQGLESELRNKMSLLKSEEDRLLIEENEWKRELHEAAFIGGREALDYDTVVLSLEEESRGKQIERRRTIEKMKIRIEELGGSAGEDVLKEYKDTEDRDAFLLREVEDLEKSAASLKELIVELNTRLDVEFKEGIKKINAEFDKFFKLMFGGGSASLDVLREKKRRKARDEDELSALSLPSGEIPEEEGEEGIDITVNMPHKKIRGLEVLSGGERALTSIALLFAVSQVNPPPFIILDETDAALDEANSRKYGDMIESLSKYSQLILITHNRETMSRAGVLYGVTMGSDGVSKLLSIQFEEAVVVAK